MSIELKISNLCISCDSCRLFCPEDAVFIHKTEYHIEPWACTLCDVCVQVCPVDAIRKIDVEKLES